MSVELIDEQRPQAETVAEETSAEEVIPLPPTDLPYDDGEPLESNRHRIAMNVLIDSLHQAYQGRDDYYTSGNMFVYYSTQQIKNQDFRGPDFFATLNVDGTKERLSWVVWEEHGRYPNVIVELMSKSTAHIDRNQKKTLYEQTFKTNDYFVYNPFDRNSLQGWHLGSQGKYEEIIPNDRGWLWCASLELWLGVWDGELTKENAPWLRFYDPQDNLVLLPKEEAELERDRAENAEEVVREQAREIEQLQERLRQMGVDPDNLS
ncbi:Uma2 family endonuclease [Roseofilum casamattae]|uniref:Uma2 family endonuclease n=1 Tax=Roseofilum casamattae BLCC-M143 TaxID=3022442 RepID=A0ABT7BWU5_9CYAN|nr:Uma2 family endonuclease [Roseofilum casamattae]MDJ1183292.1 Uma2 family endonuclease [Roseofilum casamattae BLCC-M143]